MQNRKRLASVALESDTGELLARNCPSLAQSDVVFFPDDVIRLIMGCLFGRQVAPPNTLIFDNKRDRYLRFQKTLCVLRTVNKQWARVGGELMRWLLIPRAPHHVVPADLPRAFPTPTHINLIRCALDSNDARMFSDTLKAFSFRPRDKICGSIGVHSTTERIVLDCHGTATNFDRQYFIRGCPHCREFRNGVSIPYANDNMGLHLLNAISHPDVFASVARADSVLRLESFQSADGLCYALQQGFRVQCYYRIFRATKPPNVIVSPLCAPLLEIEVSDLDVDFSTLMDWLDPRLWRNGVLPKVQIHSGYGANDYLTKFVADYLQKHQLVITLRLV